MRPKGLLLPALAFGCGLVASAPLHAQRPEPPFYQSVAWSPDGKQIVFCAVLESWDEGFGVYVQDAGGSNRRMVSQPGEGALYPAWSPDGKRIAYGAGKGDAAEIWIVDVASGERLQITRNDSRDAGPSWSPDGRHLAFHSKRDGNSEIYVMHADGSEPRRLTANDIDDWSPMWSPRGDAIVYYATRRQGGIDDLCVLRFPVTDAGPVFEKARATTLPATGVFPSWSSDGRHIVFSDRHDEEQALYQVADDGSNRKLLYEGAFYGAWSPDGGALAVIERATDAEGKRRYAIRIRSANEEKSE